MKISIKNNIDISEFVLLLGKKSKLINQRIIHHYNLDYIIIFIKVIKLFFVYK